MQNNKRSYSSKILDLGKWDSNAIKHYSSLDRIQKQLRKGNWAYISDHPEIRAIIRVIMHQVINANPDNVRQFIADFFNCRRTPMLVQMINTQLKYVKEQLKRGRWSKFDAEMLFMESPSTHSLLSSASADFNVHPVLTYALVFKKPDECGIDKPPF
ncbi:GH23291 [Drosophila grimshawi]|uniref:GH23291 n=1 Tax=Drosophila grimshawi TaxID=7222 RepID=B4K3Y7_DROGR|nr:GH23291 [Drosophila grimshawi]